MNISAGLGVAIREFPLSIGHADYLLYIDGKACGVVEAKPEGHTLRGVETQSHKYVQGLPANLPNYGLPLPLPSVGAVQPRACSSLMCRDKLASPLMLESPGCAE